MIGLIVGEYQLYLHKDSDDLDYFCLDKDKQLQCTSSIDFDDEKLAHINEESIELLTDARNYFYYRGLKFLSLERCKELRINRQRDTDKAEIDKINHLLEGSDSREEIFIYLKDMLRITFWKIRIKFVLLKIRYLLFKFIFHK